MFLKCEKRNSSGGHLYGESCMCILCDIFTPFTSRLVSVPWPDSQRGRVSVDLELRTQKLGERKFMPIVRGCR